MLYGTTTLENRCGGLAIGGLVFSLVQVWLLRKFIVVHLNVTSGLTWCVLPVGVLEKYFPMAQMRMEK